MDMPVQCPPDVTLIQIFSQKSVDIANGINNPPFMCYLQTPDNLKGKEPKGYPYFDFEAAGVARPPQVAINDISFYTLMLYGAIPLMLFAVGLIVGLLM